MEIERNNPTTDGPSEWFTGAVRMTLIAPPAPDSRLRIFDVQFDAGARTAWHKHPRGQILHVTDGLGRVGRRGGSVEEIRPGDTVRIAPDEWHWHGAGPHAAMRHLAVQEAAEDGTTTEFDLHITESEYEG